MSVFAPAYELFGQAYFDSFSDDLYNSSVYGLLGTVTLSIIIVSLLMYYYLISNYGSYWKTGYWVGWLLFTSLINFIVCHYLVTQTLLDFYSGEIPVNYGFYIVLISLVNVLWTVVIGTILSTVFKIKSVQASRTPF